VELPRNLLAKGMDKGYELVELEELYIRNIENWEKKSLQGPFYCKRGSCHYEQEHEAFYFKKSGDPSNYCLIHAIEVNSKARTKKNKAKVCQNNPPSPTAFPS
jgi:hypothetical protein